jgi:hypothetical protein
VLAIAAATVLLAGCAAPRPAPTQLPSLTAPTPTRTPTAANAPGSRVPLQCADLLSEASWKALAGTAAKVDRDESTAPTNIESIALLQYGALSCDWDGTYTSSTSNPGSELQVVVAPDSKAEFVSRFAAIMADQTQSTHPTATENVAGDQSGYWCGMDVDALGADYNLPICDAEMLISNYWVSIQVSTVNGLSRPQLTAGLAKAMIDVAARLATAGPAPMQWVAPAATPPGFCTDSTSTASVQTIVGDRKLVAYPMGPSDVYASTIGLVGRAARCMWSDPQGGEVDIDLLAGGSWAFPGFAPIAPGDSIIRSYAPMTVPGVSSALVGCAGGGCDAYLVVGSTAVEINYNDPGAARNPALLAALAAAIAAS